MNRVSVGFTADGKPAIITSGEPATVIHAGRYTTSELWVSESRAAAERGHGRHVPPGVGAGAAAGRSFCFRVVNHPGRDQPGRRRGR